MQTVLPTDWAAYLDGLKPLEALMDLSLAPEDDQLRWDLYRVFVTGLAQSYFLTFQSDARFPDWAPICNSVFTVQPNPDDAYMQAPVDMAYDYRLVGKRGGVTLLTFAIGKGFFGSAQRPGPLVGYFDADKDLTLGPDGSFEVIVSAKPKPAGHQGDWWQVSDDATYLMMRQRSYDWGEDEDPKCAVETVQWLGPKPRLTEQDIAARMVAMANYVDDYTRVWMHYHSDLRDRGVVNKLEFSTLGDNSGLAASTQLYWHGLFEIAPDEALILETKVPACRYWNMQTNDLLFNTVEYVQVQSSLNAHQAVLDADGHFRAVIALSDPGVHNWIDTAGFLSGVLMGRWYEAEALPIPSLKKVPLAEVRQHMPESTRFVTPEEREAMLRKRRLGGQLRRRW